jgi:hypothetical protein
LNENSTYNATTLPSSEQLTPQFDEDPAGSSDTLSVKLKRGLPEKKHQ